MKVARLLLCLVVLATSVVAFPSGWESSVTSNPTAGQVLYTTGSLSGPGSIAFCVTASATVAATVRVQIVDSTHATIRSEQYMPLSASGPVSTFCSTDLTSPQYQNNDEFRVVNLNLVTLGTVSLSIFQNAN